IFSVHLTLYIKIDFTHYKNSLLAKKLHLLIKKSSIHQTTILTLNIDKGFHTIWEVNVMDPFMKRAVQLAIDNVDEGGQPFGAVLVKDGKIVAEGVNELHTTYDISGHAELIAIRKAQADKETHDLSDY